MENKEFYIPKRVINNTLRYKENGEVKKLRIAENGKKALRKKVKQKVKTNTKQAEINKIAKTELRKAKEKLKKTNKKAKRDRITLRDSDFGIILR